MVNQVITVTTLTELKYTHPPLHTDTIPARLVDVLVQSSLDFIVGEEGHVAGVSYRQEIPVPQDRSPWLQDRDRHMLYKPGVLK